MSKHNLNFLPVQQADALENHPEVRQLDVVFVTLSEPASLCTSRIHAHYSGVVHLDDDQVNYFPPAICGDHRRYHAPVASARRDSSEKGTQGGTLRTWYGCVSKLCLEHQKCLSTQPLCHKNFDIRALFCA